MADILSIAKKLNKMYDSKMIVEADVVPRYELMPTGALAFDYALKGGLPYKRIIQISGKAHSGKTTLACLSLAAYQRANPDKKCVYVDVEHSIDLEFQSKMTGLDLSSLVYVCPDRLGAEQIFDMIIELQGADDVGMIVLDSVPALVSMREMNNDIEKDLGQAGHVARSLHRFCKVMQDLVHNTGNILLFVNQVRTSTMQTGAIIYHEPGGSALSFYPSVSLRCGTRKFMKNGIETNNGEDADGFKIMFSITKNKVNNIANGGGYVTFKYDTGVNYSSDAIDIAVKAGFINRPSNVTYEVVDLETGELLTVDGIACRFAGRPKLTAFFNEHPDFTEKYAKAVNDKLAGNKVSLDLLDKETLDEIMAEQQAVDKDN